MTSVFPNTEGKPEKMTEKKLNQCVAQYLHKLHSPEECVNRKML